MIYILMYFLIGFIISVIGWFWFSTFYNSRIQDGNILIYFLVSFFLWPFTLFALIIDLIHVFNLYFNK